MCRIPATAKRSELETTTVVLTRNACTHAHTTRTHTKKGPRLLKIKTKSSTKKPVRQREHNDFCNPSPAGDSGGGRGKRWPANSGQNPRKFSSVFQRPQQTSRFSLRDRPSTQGKGGGGRVVEGGGKKPGRKEGWVKGGREGRREGGRDHSAAAHAC